MNKPILLAIAFALTCSLLPAQLEITVWSDSGEVANGALVKVYPVKDLTAVSHVALPLAIGKPIWSGRANDKGVCVVPEAIMRQRIGAVTASFGKSKLAFAEPNYIPGLNRREMRMTVQSCRLIKIRTIDQEGQPVGFVPFQTTGYESPFDFIFR